MRWLMLLPDRLRVPNRYFELPGRLPWHSLPDRFRDHIRYRWQRRVLAHRIRCERAALSAMTDAELRDIGIHRAEADHEVNRGFWDLPEHRLEELDKRRSNE